MSDVSDTAPTFRDILVVDDTKANLILLRDTLSSAGYTARPAASAELAMRSINIKKPDLILLDIRMPDISGYDLCKKLKANPKTRNIPIIFISALSETSEIIKAYDVGGVDYITKPFKSELVLARVGLHLSLSQMQHQLKAQNIELRNNKELLETRVQERTQKLEEATLKADKANAAKSNFLAAMSHDLRTPLNAILGFSDMMQHKVFGDMGDPHYSEYADDINSSARLLLALVEDVLDLSKIEAGKFSLSNEEVDVEQAIDYTLGMLRQAITDHKITVSKMIPEDLPLLLCDKRILLQILSNILSNAVKFSLLKGDINVRCSYAENEGVTISVQDFGPGIEKEDLSNILNPYERLESKHARPTGGTGLGLYLTNLYVTLHGGTLSIESEAGKGTTVVIGFPPNRPKDPLKAGASSKNNMNIVDFPQSLASGAD